MSIDFQLYLIVGSFTLCCIVAAWQARRLNQVYRSKSSMVGALAFLAMGGKQAYGLLRLRSNIVEARAKGVMIEHLNAEQWLVGVVWSFVIIGGFIWWLTWQRQDLKKLGL